MMSPDEIEYNAFYHILQNKFRRKYESALSRCLMICIPCSAALQGIDISEEFVDIHILKPDLSQHRHFCSGNECHSYSYELVDSLLTLKSAPFTLSAEYIIKVLSVETGYNKEYQQYKILIVDKPLSPKFKPKPLEEDVFLLDRKITSLDEAMQFLSLFSPHASLLSALERELSEFCSTYNFSLTNPSSLSEQLHDVMSSHWVTLLKTHSFDRQRDARFQNLLTSALENFIMSRLHELVFPVICSSYIDEDSKILAQAQKLSNLGVTADQLGAPVDFSVPLPAAVVELASLDTLECPIDKLNCLRTTLDFILAELKGAIVDAHASFSGDNQMPMLTSDDMLPLLMFVIIQAKPLHMASNLFYIENFQWTLSPTDVFSYCVVSVKAAVNELLSLDPSKLLPRNDKVIRELGLEDLIKVAGEVDQKRWRKIEGPVSPLDRQRERITAMIEASTRELDDISQQHFQFLSKPVKRDALSNLRNLGPCCGKHEEDL